MLLEDYFLFLSHNDIRIKGTNVGIELVLDPYLNRGDTPEAIAARFPTVRLEHVYAAVTYYFCRQRQMDAYMERWQERQKLLAEQQAPVPHAGRARSVMSALAARFPQPAAVPAVQFA